MAGGVAVIHAVLEFVDHHSLEDIGLVVDIMEDVSPERVEDLLRNQEPADTHPEAVCEGHDGQGDDEVRKDGGDEDDERFCGDKVEEDPHDEGEEGCGGGLEVGEPVGDDGEEGGDYDCVVVRIWGFAVLLEGRTEIWKTDNEVCDQKW